MTTKRLCVHRLATEEFDAAADWYEGRLRGLGQEFIDGVDAAIEQILENPGMGSRSGDMSEVRHLPVRKFPYAVVYLELDDDVFVVAVAHGQRRPGYWRDRIAE